MAAFTTPALERPPLYAPLRRHPWLLLSLGAHVVLAASLYTAGPVRLQFKRGDDVRVHVEQSLRQTARREVQRQLRAMEEIREALEQSAGGAPSKGGDDKAAAQDPLARARQLAASIEAVQQQVRAAEMARLLKIPEREALKRVRAEAARLPRPEPARTEPPEATVARLASQARAALAQRRAQLLAQQQGTAIEPGKRLPADGRASGTAKERGTAGPGGGKNGAPGSGGAHGDGGGRGGGGDNTGMSSASGSRLDALARGLGMGPPGALTGSSLDMSSSAFSDIRGYGAYLAPPPLDVARVRPGTGRVLGAGGPFASRVVLDTWYVIGPFEGHGGDSLQAIYPPERGLDLDAVYYGKNDLPVRWTWQQDASYPSVPRPRAENAVYYAYTEVTVDQDVDLWAWIGADDDSKMWFNERLVWISGDGDKPWYRQPFYRQRTAVATRNLSEGQRKLHFHKGRNTILFKLYNGVNLMFYSVVLSK